MERWGWLLGAESLGEAEGLGGAGNHLHDVSGNSWWRRGPGDGRIKPLGGLGAGASLEPQAAAECLCVEGMVRP